MSATERCLALPEMVDLVISFLDRNDQINCLCVNSTWRDLALPHALNCILGLPRSFELYRRRITSLLNEPLAQEALQRNSRYIRSLYIDDPDILSVLAAAPHCTKLVSLLCDLGEYTAGDFDRLWPLIRKNSNLTSVHLDDVVNVVNLEELAQSLRSCSGLTKLHLECQYQDSCPFHVSDVSFRGLALLIQGMAHPHFRLKDLHIEVLISDLPDQSWTMFEADREELTPLFPNLESFIFVDTGPHAQLSGDVLFLPVLREAPELKTLSLPEMSDSTKAAAAATIMTQKPPLEYVDFDSQKSHPGYSDIIKTSRRTLNRVDALVEDTTFCEPMVRALLPINNDATDLCLRANLQQIEIGLEDSPTVSAVIRQVLTTLPNLRGLLLGRRSPPHASHQPGRLEIFDMVAMPWVCVGLETLSLSLGCHTVEGDAKETKQERRDKITQVYTQLGKLTRLKALMLGCNFLGRFSGVEFDFAFETGVQAMEPCLKHLILLDIHEVAGSRFSHRERAWVLDHAPQLRDNDRLWARQI